MIIESCHNFSDQTDETYFAFSVKNVKITAKWESIPGRLTRISRGKAGVWGVNKHGHIYRLNSNGMIFCKISWWVFFKVIV